MAKLHSYYVLCPLLDQKSFLGVSEDKETENLIVTLGRNVINKYRLSDQKQIGGWTSRDHITSPVIYDQEHESYIGVFNNNSIKLWKEDIQNIEKVKKSKFPIKIFKLLPRPMQTSLIVFINGHCSALSHALENKSSAQRKAIIKSDDEICDVACYAVGNNEYICYIVRTASGYEIINCLLKTDLGELITTQIKKVKVARPETDVYVVGKLICTVEAPVLYILWSDSKLSVFDLEKQTWTYISSVPWISTISNVSMAWMGEKHILLYGSDRDQDGAILVAFNVALGVGSCRYPIKMYSENAKLYCFNNRIILEASNHLGMFPFTLETSRNLSSLVGSYEIVEDEFTEYVDWGVGRVPSLKVNEEIEEFLKLGVTERNICIQIFPTLLEDNDYDRVLQAMEYLKDIPESVLVLLINFGLKICSKEKVDICNKEQFYKFCINNELKLSFLNRVFKVPFSDALLIPHLRNGSNLDDALFLLKYLCYLLIESDKSFDVDYESKLLDWCCLLMDAFYQQYLLTEDDKVTITLDNLKNVIMDLIQQLNAVDKVLPLLNKMLWTKSLNEAEEILPYSIELMQI